ncbi:MAG: hypothetical protein J5529_07000 [Prevotella sp.]|jgi:hypothetical protein|nr:hypothetical protein [Prevotella sp.]
MINDKNEDVVMNLNLEASIDKELLLHGFRRRDFSEEELQQLRTVLETHGEDSSSFLDDFWRVYGVREKRMESADQKPTPRFAVGDRVWVTQRIAINGVPGVGYVRKVETEWVDLGETLNGYWEVSYQLKNMRTPFTEDSVYATEIEALVAMAADFRRGAIKQANVFCRRMRSLGMNITTKELLANFTDFV